jgi:hypothetical protein
MLPLSYNKPSNHAGSQYTKNFTRSFGQISQSVNIIALRDIASFWMINFADLSGKTAGSILKFLKKESLLQFLALYAEK